MRRLAAALGLARVHFEDGLFGAAKEAAYHEADIFVLPTLNENFGLVVAEALANGTPVISTKGAPWQGLVDNGCGWWIDHGVEPLAEALSAAMAKPQTALAAMGARGRAWMIREFCLDDPRVLVGKGGGRHGTCLSVVRGREGAARIRGARQE
jgi:glycosyltransferase involved in cell wall biosynthesis